MLVGSEISINQDKSVIVFNDEVEEIQRSSQATLSGPRLSEGSPFHLQYQKTMKMIVVQVTVGIYDASRFSNQVNRLRKNTCY